MIKFFGKPLMEIKSKLTNKVIFRFDSKGEFITDDMAIIERAMGHFDYIPVKIEEAGTRTKKTIEKESIQVSTKENEINYDEFSYFELKKMIQEKNIITKNATKEAYIEALKKGG